MRRGFDYHVLEQFRNSPLADTTNAADRVRVLSDTICAVAVAGRNQVLAMTLAANGRETRLFVAQNSTQVPRSVEDFLHDLWTCLKSLAQRQMLVSRQKGQVSQPQEPDGDSRKPYANLDHQVRALTAKVYRYCYKRFHRQKGRVSQPQ